MSSYVKGTNRCNIEAYTKEETDTLLNTINETLTEVNTTLSSKANSSDVTTEITNAISDEPAIHYGTSTPSSSLGKNGDIYLKYSS